MEDNILRTLTDQHPTLMLVVFGLVIMKAAATDVWRGFRAVIEWRDKREEKKRADEMGQRAATALGGFLGNALKAASEETEAKRL